MQCPVCKDSSNAPTGHLELVSALSVTVSPDGVLNRNSAVLLDEYLACNNCTDLNCDAEDCVAWFWEQAGTDRRIRLGNPSDPPAKVGSSIVTPAAVEVFNAPHEG